MYDDPGPTSISMTNTAPEDERLSLLRRLIDIERDIDHAQRERDDIEKAREVNKIRMAKTCEVRHEIVSQLGSLLGLYDDSAKASPALDGIRSFNEERY